MNYDQPNGEFSTDEAQVLLAWLFFFWLIIPYHAVVGLIKIILGAFKE